MEPLPFPWLKGNHWLGLGYRSPYAQSHIADTVSTQGASAHQAAQQKITKYSKQARTHAFYITAVEITRGTQNIHASRKKHAC